MHDDTALIALVATGFVLACAFGFLATRVRLPPIVDYLLAGVAIGPFTPGFVGDARIAAQLAEIGVMLLMLMGERELALGWRAPRWSVFNKKGAAISSPFGASR
jgi:CPA2 family monovalent cation:H+ antiporter-2